jgi:glycosyltransferase involved in cell wall biosynthesis
MDRIRVHHGADPWGIGGPVVKLQRMQKYFPDYLFRYNIIYSVSAKVSSTVCAIAQKKGVKIVQHINSLWNPIYRPDYNEKNKPFKEIYRIADHVVFGSNHAKKSAEIFLGKCRVPYTIIYNSIDMSHFAPQKRPNDRFNILGMGHCMRHRIEPLIRSMPYVNKKFPNARLIIAGPLKKGEGIWNCSKKSFERLARELGVKDLEFLPEFTQEDAPSIYALGDILAHIMHMDWTPNTVIESMACGLPILHSGNGGLPEIVGEAGLSLDMPFDWNSIHSPEPELLAEKIIQLYKMREKKGKIARKIAVKCYNLQEWVKKHSDIFESLLSGNLT